MEYEYKNYSVEMKLAPYHPRGMMAKLLYFMNRRIEKEKRNLIRCSAINPHEDTK